LANKKQSNKKLDFRGKADTLLEDTKYWFRGGVSHPSNIKKGITAEISETSEIQKGLNDNHQ